MKNFLMFAMVAGLLVAATSGFAVLPPPPPAAPGPSMGPGPSALASPSAVDPRVVAGLKKVSDRSKKAERVANQAIREVRALRRGASQATTPPSPITAAMGDAADAYTDQFQWGQAILRNNGDEALARLDPAYQAYLQVRQDPAHQTADAKSYAGLIGYDHKAVLDLKYQVAALQGRMQTLETSDAAQTAAIEANDGLTRSVARETATALGVTKDGAKPSKEEKKSAAAWLAGL